MVNLIRRTPPPDVPFALMGKWPFQRGDPHVIRVPEARIAWYLSQGWRLISRDSDVPLTLHPGQYFDPSMARAGVVVTRPSESEYGPWE